MPKRKKLTFEDLKPHYTLASEPRVKLRIEGFTDLPNPAQPPLHECRRDVLGGCIWAYCPLRHRPDFKFAQLRPSEHCPLDHRKEWADYERTLDHGKGTTT